MHHLIGAVESNAVIFANSWKSKQCINDKPVLDGCTVNVQRVKEAKHRCGILSDALFIACHQVVNPIGYIHQCEQEVCGCPPGEKCHCQVVQDYARECVNQGVTIQWSNMSECGEFLNATFSIDIPAITCSF